MQATHADIEGELHRIFAEHPDSDKNESGEPTIPADALVDVFRAFSDLSNGPLLSLEETEMLKMLLANNPGLEVTPGIILQFIAEKTRHSPSPSPDSPYDSQNLDFLRGRDLERNVAATERSSSNESNSASHHTGSRPSSRGPMTPHTRSVFDTERRQRSTPLNNAPSSWAGPNKRPAPASRRRSVDGRLSDSEYSDGPSAFSRSISGRTRSRAPSNPVSPSESFSDLSGSFSPIGSPSFSSSLNRPHSRAGSMSGPSRSQSFSLFGSPNVGNDSIDDENTISNALLNTSGEYDDSSLSFKNAISSLPMPSSAIDSDSDDEQDTSLGLVMERNIVSSNASMEPLERLDALQRQNAELARKCMEAERTLQNRLAEHESELEEMQGKLEEMRSELSATKREEKELRSKERQNTTQISALELEVSKVTKALEHSKATYTSLQRQYQEQCSASEKYRSDLRAREDLIRSLREASSLHDIEVSKWVKEQQTYEDRIALLQDDLNLAQGVYVQLDEQKQENLMLKETIDRMRYEMDEMRAGAALGLLPAGNASTATVNSLSKTLGAELMGKMKWDEEDGEGEDKQAEEDVVEEGTSLDSERSEGDDSVTVYEEDDEDDDDVIQTIITRKKRKVASRAKEFPNPSSRNTTFTEMQHEEVKEYSDMGIQYDPTLICVSSGVQTLPPPTIPTASLSIQTDPPSTTRTYAMQTDSPLEKPKKVTMEIEIQTDTLDIDGPIATAIPANAELTGEDSLASSSSTILPPTPKQRLLSLSAEDEPPTYNQVAAQRLEEEKERKRVNDVLTRWHLGAKLRKVLVLGHNAHVHSHDGKSRSDDEEGEESSGHVVDEVEVEGIEGGIPEDLIEEWKALKAEMGVECGVIDKIIEHSTKIPPRSPTTDSKEKGKRRSGRFYNIYNTYVYGGGGSDTSTTDENKKGDNHAGGPPGRSRSLGMTLTNLATQSLLFVSASAVVFVALTPYIPYLLSAVLPGGNDNHVPGGPTPFDRQAWRSYNTLGGGGGEGITFAAATQRGARGLFGGWMGATAGIGAGIGVGAVNVGGDGVPGDGVVTDAVWRVLGRVGGGAARIARGWPT